ncbi:helix-turn-helix domain-containing protein [Actinoplanes sp. NPDC049596]|uniref:helix-turn-helix domain-containing protein n=1 Tax=unclassified Actinoplanes TaxID=2626549 RepID=UPI0034349B2D
METTVVQEPEVAAAVVLRTTADGRSDVIVTGPRTRGSYHPSRPTPVCVRMMLPPGHARAALRVPVSTLVDRAVRLADLWGDEGRRLTGELLADPSRLAEVFGGRGDPAVTAAIGALSESAGLGEASGRAGVSERYLRTLFAREVGLSPKHFARISRVRRVLSLAGRERWAAVADAAGYFDQAHMIGDFRSVMGVSPGAYVSGRLPATTPCLTLRASAG